VAALRIVVVSLFAESRIFGKNAVSKRGIVLVVLELDCTESALMGVHMHAQRRCVCRSGVMYSAPLAKLRWQT